MLVAFNKIDLPAAAEAWPAFDRARRERGPGRRRRSPRRPGRGWTRSVPASPTMLPSAEELDAPPEPAGVVVHRIEAMADGFVVERDADGAFRVRGKRIERIAAQTNFDVEESAERFQRDLARLGIDAELRRAGIVARRPRADRRRRARVGAAAVGGRVTDGLRGATGVFGGTFDPIHVAHLAIAEAARDALGLRRVLFVPAAEPPHKPGRQITPVEHRLAMVEAGHRRQRGVRGQPDRGRPTGPSYTVDTLEALRPVDATDRLALILSAESFAELPTWHEPERILELAERDRRAARRIPRRRTRHSWRATCPGRARQAVFLDGPRIRLSASEIRERAAAGRRCAISSRMRSRRISATMPSTRTQRRTDRS